MAIFLNKRLLRFVGLVAVCLGLVALMLPREGEQSAISSVIPSNFQFDSNKLWGSTSESSKADEKQRYDAEKEQAKTEDQKTGESEASPALPYTGDTDAEPKKDEASVWEFMKPSYEKKGQRPKACFVSLVRNEELDELLSSIGYVERKFNHQFHYPWVFMNEVEFTEDFKEKVTKAISGEPEFVLIPKEYWSYPEYIDLEKAAKEREEMVKDNVIYGFSEPYRHMCRFQSGFFWQQKAMDKYDWYWRVEPGIKIHCDVNYDIFQWMQDHDKAYGFTISIHEYGRTIATLWHTVRNWWWSHPQYIAKDNLLRFISDDDGESYNLCHFWSNFEIANLNLWRSPAYRSYFKTLDETGSFFYERWGDAPVHSIAASLMLPKDKIHYFSDVGYFHNPYNNCPLDKNVFKERKCECNQEDDFTFHSYACGVQYYNAQGLTKPVGWEKYNT